MNGRRAVRAGLAEPVPIDPVPSDPEPGPGDGGPGDTDLATVAEELYGLPLAQFTATRDARAAQARKAGDQELATAIKGLKKPTTGAWLANLLVRERRPQVGHLLDLGAELRQAQAGLAIDELRRLSQARHKVVSDLRDEARVLAREVGQPISDAVALELEATLEAALADADAADALRSGRLTASLRYSGLGLSDTIPAATGATAGASGPLPPASAPPGVAAQPAAKSRRSGPRAPRPGPPGGRRSRARRRGGGGGSRAGRHGAAVPCAGTPRGSRQGPPPSDRPGGSAARTPGRRRHGQAGAAQGRKGE